MKLTMIAAVVFLFAYTAYTVDAKGFEDQNACLKNLGVTTLACFHPANMIKCKDCLKEYRPIFELMHTAVQDEENPESETAAPAPEDAE